MSADLRAFATQKMEVKGWFGTMDRGAAFCKRKNNDSMDSRIFPKECSMACCCGKYGAQRSNKFGKCRAEQNQTRLFTVRTCRALSMVLCIQPFQKGFPNLWDLGTLILDTILGLVFLKTHMGKL